MKPKNRFSYTFLFLQTLAMSLKELRRLWGQRKQSAVPCDPGGLDPECPGEPKPSLPLLQVWPSQDSPRGEADGQSFVFLPNDEHHSASSSGHHDSGIDSVQVGFPRSNRRSSFTVAVDLLTASSDLCSSTTCVTVHPFLG